METKKMVSSINSTTTQAEGWQKQCWQWAEAKQSFEIHDLQSQHFMFCQEICAEYNYTYQYFCRRTESVAKFMPMS
jgi:hypothetical protein